MLPHAGYLTSFKTPSLALEPTLRLSSSPASHYGRTGVLGHLWVPFAHLTSLSKTWELVSGLCIFTTSLETSEGGPASPKAGSSPFLPWNMSTQKARVLYSSPAPLA